MHLYVIRHAQSANNALYAQTGSEVGRKSDPELTEIGHQQAQALAQFLAQTNSPTSLSPDQDIHNRHSFPFTHLYTSLMLRAITTGHYIAEAMQMPLHVWFDIHEWGGIYLDDEHTGERVGQPGAARSELEPQFPRLVLPDWVDESGWWNRPFEPREHALDRAHGFVKELLARHQPDDRVAIVTHGGFAYALLWNLVQFGHQNDRFETPRDVWFWINNTSISRIHIGPDHINMVYWNRTEHLPATLIT
ncbi:MAG: histidine phosphatase family protein [Chloroflexota bacterium]|nr:histidine phosphatase family protein [Anaerolineales bacterium]MCA9975075.1 histidine phosphatase family protein [Anaerolineales bacterium]MCB8968540.1 histidine phosphatase family protein [Ardenticatenaceae bacterium]